MSTIVCAPCWDFYQDTGPCDEGKPPHSPHRRGYPLPQPGDYQVIASGGQRAAVCVVCKHWPHEIDCTARTQVESRDLPSGGWDPTVSGRFLPALAEGQGQDDSRLEEDCPWEVWEMTGNAIPNLFWHPTRAACIAAFHDKDDAQQFAVVKVAQPREDRDRLRYVVSHQTAPDSTAIVFVHGDDTGTIDRLPLSREAVLSLGTQPNFPWREEP